MTMVEPEDKETEPAEPVDGRFFSRNRIKTVVLGSLVALVVPFPRPHRNIVLGAALVLICAIELRQYYILAVQYPLYELITEHLVRALQILKSP